MSWRSASDALADLWAGAGWAPDAMPAGVLAGDPADPVLPSAHRVVDLLQASLGAAAQAAAAIASMRADSASVPSVAVDRRGVAVECSSHFTLDGTVPPMWDPLSGLYRCGAAVGEPGWLRLHANFVHHRDAALRVLGCAPGADTPRAAVELALAHWRCEAAEQAIHDAGGVAAAVRSADAWDALPQASALAAEPLLGIARIGDADPRPWPGPGDGSPLAGLRVLDLTRILAGPVAARWLAGFGADVLMVGAPHLPHIAALPDTSRGKRSCWLDLRDARDQQRFDGLLAGADVHLQAYRPGALASRGWSDARVAERHPGIVCASLAAWGFAGPWAGRRGFDSLVQAACGLNLREAAAFGGGTPRALPVQALDHAAGHLLAFGIQTALARQRREGGSWSVRVSLARVAQWLREGGTDGTGLGVQAPDPEPWMETAPSAFGALRCVRPSVSIDGRPMRPRRPSVPPGHDAPVWA